VADSRRQRSGATSERGVAEQCGHVSLHLWQLFEFEGEHGWEDGIEDILQSSMEHVGGQTTNLHAFEVSSPWL
jgi:hypothetical protein